MKDCFAYQMGTVGQIGTMKNYPGSLEQNNIFNQNLDEEYEGEEEGQGEIVNPDTVPNNEEMVNIESSPANEVPVGIFEDVKDHIEDIRPEEDPNINKPFEEGKQ